MPSQDTLYRIMEESHKNKYECLFDHYCEGKHYSVGAGVLKKCGKMNPFIVWEKHVNERKLQPDLSIFMDHYDIPSFDGPPSAQKAVNAFFQAKYGMFYCHDQSKKFGLVEYYPSLVQHLERNPRQLKRTWNLAILTALSNKQISFEELKGYEKDYQKGKKWV